MKKSLTRKLTIAVIALVFAVVSLSTSTYAWFTMSDTAQLNAFEAQVKAGEGIEIAVTATDNYSGAQWYTGNVPAPVIKDAFTENGFQQFDALSAISKGAKFAELDGTENTGTGYIMFWVHVKTAEAGKVNLTQIKLDSFKNITPSNADPIPVEAWTSDVAYRLLESTPVNEKDVNVNDKVLYKVEDASRIYIKSKTAADPTIFEKAAVAAQGENGTFVANNGVGLVNPWGAQSYYNEKNPNAPLQKNENNYDSYDTSKISNTEFTDTVNNKNVTLELGESNGAVTISFQVKIWIEGWDSECLNAIFNQALKVQFSVGLVDPQA